MKSNRVCGVKMWPFVDNGEVEDGMFCYRVSREKDETPNSASQENWNPQNVHPPTFFDTPLQFSL